MGGKRQPVGQLWKEWPVRLVVYCGLVGLAAVTTNAVEWVATT